MGEPYSMWIISPLKQKPERDERSSGQEPPDITAENATRWPQRKGWEFGGFSQARVPDTHSMQVWKPEGVWRGKKRPIWGRLRFPWWSQCCLEHGPHLCRQTHTLLVAGQSWWDRDTDSYYLSTWKDIEKRTVMWVRCVQPPAYHLGKQAEAQQVALSHK